MVLRDILARFGFEVDDKKLKDVDGKVDGFIGKLQQLGRALIGGTAAVGLFKFADSLAKQGAALDDASQRLGIGTDSLQSLGFAADQSGSNIEALTTGLLRMQDLVGDALTNATGEGAKAFKQYGIAIKDANGHVKGSDELLLDVADRMGKAKSEAEKTTIAVGLFGRQGRELIPMLKQGREGIAKLREEFQELGGGFTQDAVKAAADYDDALSRFNLTVTSLRARIAIVLLPVLRRFVDAATHGVAAFIGLTSHGRLVETILGGLAVVLGRLALATLRAFAPVLAGVAAWAALALVVEDVIVLFEGGQSVIGDFIDSLFGVGTATKVVTTLKDTWHDVVQAIKDAIAAIRIFNKLKTGKDLSEEDLLAAERMGFETGGVSRGIRGRTNEENLILDAQKHGQLAVPKGFTRKQVQHFIEARRTNPNAHLVAPTVQQNNTYNIHGVTDPKQVAKQVDEHHKRRNKEAHDALIKHAEPAT